MGHKNSCQHILFMWGSAGFTTSSAPVVWACSQPPQSQTWVALPGESMWPRSDPENILLEWSSASSTVSEVHSTYQSCKTKYMRNVRYMLEEVLCSKKQLSYLLGVSHIGRLQPFCYKTDMFIILGILLILAYFSLLDTILMWASFQGNFQELTQRGSSHASVILALGFLVPGIKEYFKIPSLNVTHFGVETGIKRTRVFPKQECFHVIQALISKEL